MNYIASKTLEFSDKDFAEMTVEEAAILGMIKENFLEMTIAQFHWMLGLVRRNQNDLKKNEIKIFDRLCPNGSFKYDAAIIDLVWLFNKSVEFCKNKANSN